ncbi:MAG: hypothetical protein K2O34_10610, partial [Acetatifactor sp.]|nr:hypothetical protein [Acetatifactor sp.]
EEMSDLSTNKTLVDYVGTGYWWIILSTILFLLVAFLFLWLASRRINPIKGHVRRRTAQVPPQMQQPQMMQASQQMQQPVQTPPSERR